MDYFASDMDTAKRKTVAGLIGAVIIFTLFECARTARFGEALRGEWNLWTMGMATMEFSVAFLALTCAGIAYYMKRRQIVGDGMWFIWLIIAAAFQFFVLDETLEFHERLGKLLRHSEFGGQITGFRPQNLVEGVYFIITLALTFIIIKKMKANTSFVRFYLAGVALIAVEVILGVLPEPMMKILYDNIQFHFPELFEMSGVTCFACSFLVLAFDYIKQVAEWLTEKSVRQDAVEHVLSLEKGG